MSLSSLKYHSFILYSKIISVSIGSTLQNLGCSQNWLCIPSRPSLPGKLKKSFMTFSFWKMSQLSNFPSVQTYLPSKEGIYVWQLLPCSLYPLKGVETSSHKMSVCLKFLLKDHEWSFYMARSAVGFKILAKYIWDIFGICLKDFWSLPHHR